MVNKLILTQIMKNEAHVAERMLDSIKSIVDGICVIDTGSTDDSINIVREWGEKNNIETYVFERPFDNFENSRNYSIEKAREMFLKKDLKYQYYGFWLDFDEILHLDENFDKNKIKDDLLMFETYIDMMKYTRNEMYKLDMPFKFYGPVHEYLVCDEKIKSSSIIEGLHVEVRMEGGSWKGNISKKYKDQAFVLEAYIDENRKDPRWIFYTAQSYKDSASTQNRAENDERLRRAIKYYKERVNRNDGYYEERFYSQWKIGTLKLMLEKPWSETHQELLKAYSMDNLRGEPIKTIIDYYLKVGEWHNAYLYSKFGVVNFHNKNPYPNRYLFIDNSLYDWKFLEVHCASCYYTARKEEGKETFDQLLKIYEESPELFNDNDKKKIESNKNMWV